MKLRDHPNIEWPPSWSAGGETSRRGDDGIMRDVDLIESAKLMLSKELDGKLYFAELQCLNDAFASRLYEKIKLFVGRPMSEVGEIDF